MPGSFLENNSEALYSEVLSPPQLHQSQQAAQPPWRHKYWYLRSCGGAEIHTDSRADSGAQKRDSWKSPQC